MCGITGYLHYDISRPVSSDLLKKMTDIIKHRGPDGEGFYVKNNVALGHRRLSIIDLDTGNQPMFSSDKTIALVFNGEIYNYIELREELINFGHVFHTASDTEVIIQSYLHWGIDCLNRFNGCWSFALWDENKKTMFLSRDRIGEKPLFYTEFNHTFIFGSEAKCLFAYGVPKEINTELTDIYLTLCYIPAPFTFFKNIKKLKPGHYLKIHSGNIEEIKYWDMPQINEKEMMLDRKIIYEEFEYLLNDSVRIRMRSDVPFGAFLSGGLDSSSIVSIMSEISQHPVETFTMGFHHKSFDESNLAALVAEKFKTNHHLKYVEQDSFDEALKKVLFHYDEPFGDSSAIPTDYVSKFAWEHVKMVLTGDGGDEVLSGYTVYQGEKFAANYKKYNPAIIRAFLGKSIGKLTGFTKGNIRNKLVRIKNVLESSNMDFNNRLISKLVWMERSSIKNLLLLKNVYPVEEYIADFMKTCTYKDNFYRLMYFQTKISLPDDMLVKVDRMCMANSLEARVPFLDHRLVELMAHVHKDEKMRGLERKSVLRNTFGRKLPAELLNAPKKGFGVPVREWFKEKSFEDKIENLKNSSLPLDKKQLLALIERNNAGLNDYGNFIWMLFVLKKYFDN